MRVVFAYVVVCLLLIGIHADAEARSGSGGNGGQSIRCQNDPRYPKVTAYDLYEGERLFGYKYLAQVKGNALDIAKRAAKELDDLDFPSGNLTFTERLAFVADQIHNAPVGDDLELTSDIQAVLLPNSCELVQTIIFHNDLSFSLNTKVWNRLDKMSKAALLLHETIYWSLRETEGEQDSQRSRRIVSYLLSGRSMSAAPLAFTEYRSRSVVCHETNSNLGSLLLSLDPAGMATLLMDRQAKPIVFSTYGNRLSSLAARDSTETQETITLGAVVRDQITASITNLMVQLKGNKGEISFVQKQREGNARPLDCKVLEDGKFQ